MHVYYVIVCVVQRIDRIMILFIYIFKINTNLMCFVWCKITMVKKHFLILSVKTFHTHLLWMVGSEATNLSFEIYYKKKKRNISPSSKWQFYLLTSLIIETEYSTYPWVVILLLKSVLFSIVCFLLQQSPLATFSCNYILYSRKDINFHTSLFSLPSLNAAFSNPDLAWATQI